VLWQVAPQPGATLRLRQVPIEAQLSTALAGLATLSVDGRPVLTGLPAPYVSYLPPSPLAPGSHRLRVDVLMPGRTFSYRWQVRIAKGAQARVGPYDADTYQALFAVNRIRSAAGLSPWRLSLPLEGASRAHSSYFLHNFRRYGTLTDSVHSEQPGWPYYVGRTPWARDVAFGYNGDGDSEVMAFGVGTQEAVELWLDSVYHRFGLLDPGLTSMGFGIAGKSARSDDLPVTTLNAGYESQAEVPNGRSVVWPVAGQTDVPLSFQAGEIPDPLANFPGARYPAGYPVTVSFFGLGVKGLEVHAASLSQGGRQVGCHLLTPQVEHNPAELGMSAALLPNRPLLPSSVYNATFAGRYRDSAGWHPFRVATSFTTATA
jgi:uncharacterized protein YkwD